MHVHYNSGPFFHYYQFTRAQTDYYYTVTRLMVNGLLASRLASYIGVSICIQMCELWPDYQFIRVARLMANTNRTTRKMLHKCGKGA